MNNEQLTAAHQAVQSAAIQATSYGATLAYFRLLLAMLFLGNLAVWFLHRGENQQVWGAAGIVCIVIATFLAVIAQEFITRDIHESCQHWLTIAAYAFGLISAACLIAGIV